MFVIYAYIYQHWQQKPRCDYLKQFILSYGYLYKAYVIGKS